MISNRFFYLSLAMAGCTAAYAIGRHTRQIEKQQHKDKEGLRTWEDEGGNLAPSEARATARSAAAV